MGLFANQKPRGFYHPYIYADPRRERLDRMKEEARRELGLSQEKPVSPEDVRGKFVEATRHLRRRRERGARPWHVAVYLFFIVLLMFLWGWLLSV